MSPPPRTSESLARRIRMARGLEPADLCVEHVNVVDFWASAQAGFRPAAAWTRAGVSCCPA